MHSKKLIKIGEFLCSHFDIEDGGKYATFPVVMLYYFKKGTNASEIEKKKIVQCMGKVPRLTERVKSGL